MKKFIFSVMALAVAVSCSVKPVSLQVKTGQGIVEGFLQDSVKTFLGIPFAQAPVGELRWKAPQKPLQWEGIRDANSFGDDPMQPNIFNDMVFRGAQRSEDCLYLNVWTCAQSVKDRLPVLIYFNGGGLMAGSASEPRYDGASIAKEGVVSVTANYREGIFGFFSHPELSEESPWGASGNYGFLDQVAAIDWVRENIAAFGGDPCRINIVGESAGSFSVSLLMASPLSRGKIAGAMLSSGAEVMPYYSISLDEAEESGKTRLENAGIADIASARAMSADEIQTIFPPLVMPRVVIDGNFMTEAPDSVFAKGLQADVPLLAGWNSHEATPYQYLLGDVPTVENYKKAMTSVFGDMTDEIFTAYGILKDEDVTGQNGVDLASDLFTGFPTWKVCDYHANTSKQPVYRYKFNHGRPAQYGDALPQASGAIHSADIEYAMGNLDLNSNFPWKEEDYTVSRTFLSFYVNFCKNGNPNGEGLPLWTPINGKTDAAPVMQIDIITHETASVEKENAYRTLEKFYRGR